MFLYGWTLYGLPLLAQTDSLRYAQLDSLLAQKQVDADRFLTYADSLRLADSLLEVRLRTQLDDQRFGTLRQRNTLRNRLDSLQQNQGLREDRLRTRADSLRATALGIPVVIFQDTVFSIYAPQGPYTPSERAREITREVERLVKEDQYQDDQLAVIEGPQQFYVMHGRTVLMAVSERDAFWAGTPAQALAEEYLDGIRDAVGDYKARTHFLYTLYRVGLLIVFLGLFFYGVRYMNRWLTRLNVRLLIAGRKRFGQDLKFKHYELLTVERAEYIAKRVLTGLKWILISVVVYFALPIVFSIFPATEAIAQTLLDLVLSPLTSFFSAFIGFVPEMITIAVILIITHYFVNLLRFFAREVSLEHLNLPGFYPEWAYPTFNLLRVLIYVFAFIVIFPYLPGSDSPVFQGVSVFLGLLISLGSSSAISNLIAGLVIIYMRAFKVGDRVKIGETTGDVVEKTMLVTRVRTIKNENVTIPNASILAGSTINYSATANELGLILSSTITIGYDVPWRQVHELLINSALKTEGVQQKPNPFVLQTSLDDFYVSYQINLYTDQPGRAAKIYSELHSHIQDAFQEAGIEIMSPHYRANRDGSDITIPPNWSPPQQPEAGK